MEKFIRWTSWGMETPKSYGMFHISFVVIGFIVAITLAWFARKLNSKQNRILLFCVGIFLVITEIYKQLFYYYVLGNNHYPLWILPWQLCSVPMYLCIICACCKSEKFNSWLYEFMFAFNLLSGAIAFTEPSGLNHPYITLTLHSYIWHLSLVFIGFYLYFSKRACMGKKGYFKALAVFMCCVSIAQILNVSLFQFGNLNMFFISPYEQSSIVVFHDIWAKCGWFVNMILFVLALIIASSIVYYACWGFRLLNKKRLAKRNINK